ncbi:MAG: hypothetical protein E6H06_13705 [Bacteroidetes bacterium]|nr:MAG: hypothetical protein E6H06_13705 [Bacteroidota bacterium]
MKKTILLLTVLLSLKTFSQSVSGYWYGAANVKSKSSTNNYLVELILHQDRTLVKGIVNYYFKKTYRSIKVNGNYNSLTRQLTLFDIPVTYHGSIEDLEVDCMMNFAATLRVAKVSSNLVGSFQGKPEYRYTCPDVNFNLKLNADISKEDSILHAIRVYKETYQVWKPTYQDTLIAVNIIPRKVENYVIDSEYKQRENVVSKEITVSSDSLKVDFFDNGEIDGDSISIFYNNKLIAFNRILSTKAVHFTVALDTTRQINEITMFADNLGSIPPNTALMVVTDGRKRYEIPMASNLQRNATLKIRRKKK